MVWEKVDGRCVLGALFLLDVELFGGGFALGECVAGEVSLVRCWAVLGLYVYMIVLHIHIYIYICIYIYINLHSRRRKERTSRLTLHANPSIAKHPSRRHRQP